MTLITQLGGLYMNKELKALDIIDKRNVNIGWLKLSDNCAKYNLGVGTNQRLKRTEYLLIKEVLKYE